MSQKQLAKLLKAIIIGLFICGIFVGLFLVPYVGNSLLKDYPEFTSRFWPWIILIYVVITPCFIVLFKVWSIALSIENDKSFTKQNCKILQQISYIALFDSAFFLIMNLVYMLFNISHASIFLASFFVAFVGIAFSVVSGALSHLVKKASDIREENEYTI
ncbi:DUF2975 domain-containing protein [Clostridium sp. 'deep sea']|uniref:DUF2975 domain-containing protein n=1 Tax=Clostridium sp. 'deep sea' TaxID=2779445 RepID=UPI0018965C9A|nr:DUF2975 domain-containing protein [Clostridium sp. 'deep sea']QOR35254.1 DUF2975 domain-containing protein [Clostridium sp. 'deep sea']